MTLLARTLALKESRAYLKATLCHTSGGLKETLSYPSLTATFGVVSVRAGWPAAAWLGGGLGTL